jgi:hypothetical protein
MKNQTTNTNQILTSSDHHANWEALEGLFKIANQKKIPFIINGDIIGDYNFEQIKNELNLKFPNEISTQVLQENLSNELFEKYLTYSQIEQAGGDASKLLHQVPQHLKQQAIEKLNQIIQEIQTKEFQNRLQQIFKNNPTEHIISEHTIKLKSLYQIIVKLHAKKLAELINKYQVQTYFLLGNHEPINFVNLTKQELYKLNPNNQNLLKDLGKINKIENANGIHIAGIPNVCALMPFLDQIYNKQELDEMFSHQRGQSRPILFGNIKEKLKQSNEHKKDFDWIRIMNKSNNKNNQNEKQDLDIFFTHGQVGKGAWRDDKYCNEMPTLHVAAMLSELSQITIDGHLHTTHQMTNDLGKETLRAVGNKAFLLKKNQETKKIEKELIETNAEYDSRGKIDLRDLDLHNEILNHIFSEGNK